MDKMITIGILSKITGVSTRSIRHYESIGLLSCTAYSDSNYRLYGEKEVKRLQQILLLRSLGFSLNEVLDIMTADENVRIAEIFESRLNMYQKEISRLSRKKEMLQAVTHIYKTNGLEYINNFHYIKEMVSMSTKFTKIFNRLDLRLQIKIIKELYKTGTLSPETLREIGSESGQILLNELHMIIVKTLLNGVEPSIEKAIIETLEKEDPEFAEDAKKAMFTFSDIAKLPDDTIKKWLGKCKDNELSIALKDSGSFLKNKIFSNLELDRTERLKQNIANDDLAGLDQEYTAMNNLIEVLRQMELNGEIIIERFE